MTRASRPTFEAARGGRGKGEGDLSQLSKQHSSRDLPYTKIKYRRKMKMKILKRRVMMMVLQLYLQNWKELKKKELKSRPGSTCHHLLHMLNVCHPIFQRLTQNSPVNCCCVLLLSFHWCRNPGDRTPQLGPVFPPTPAAACPRPLFPALAHHTHHSSLAFSFYSGTTSFWPQKIPHPHVTSSPHAEMDPSLHWKLFLETMAADAWPLAPISSWHHWNQQNSQRCSVIHIKKSKNQLILQHRTTKTNLTGWHRSYLPQEESGGGQWRRRACADLGRASALPLPPGPQRPRRSRLAAPPSSERPREH
ncbi:uncharacterized protein [Manis javanica]|uniref:uncharacterized protein isoform X2 n=1 Tax=Manis javanica TaxID=9974 RepID=UPI003C6D4C3D